jgi:hypothetical protein
MVFLLLDTRNLTSLKICRTSRVHGKGHFQQGVYTKALMFLQVLPLLLISSSAARKYPLVYIENH